jgi:cob(I)alamin adenosyltransferase
MKIYTKFGDAGQTVLFDGQRVPKDHLRIETYGTVDELNSHLGLAIVDCKDPPLKDLLTQLQHHLLDLGSDLATPLDSKNSAKVHRIGAHHVAFLEQQIDAATAQLPILKRFILPGGSVTAARLHIARTVCRRTERCLVTLLARETAAAIGDQPLIYLNRLSDLLFTLARLANHHDGLPDLEWDSTKRL